MRSSPDSRDPPPPDAPDAAGLRRVRLRVRGIVQGVGFRPFVYRLAGEEGMAGFVRNDASGVLAEVEGPPAEVRAFLERLPAEAPPLSAIESLEWEEISPRGEEGFRIVESEGSARAATLISPDTATCADCLAELFDPGDRRHRYPFVNCTNCGPRFSIVRGVPYDRPLTTMASFVMCDACREEYEDPGDRRFHAQPNACPDCGPRVRLLTAAGEPADTGDVRDPVEATARALLDGRVVAVKGLGGYHLACRADDEGAVGRLRKRKHREDKPFALMVPDLVVARVLVDLGPEEEALLSGIERPIVLARRRAGAEVAASVAPGHRDLGVMLPYTPLHHLLLADAGLPLVMTSGNVSDEPIAYRDDEALERLADIADFFLVHDRPIETRTDDSVVRVVSVAGVRRPLMLRRSRGWVPRPVELPDPASPPLLACGAHLKNTFTVADGRRAWVSHHIGDLENYETLRSFEEGVEHLKRIFEVEPALAVHDLHPDYLSTRYARERAGAKSVGVQHHFAHLAACLAEHAEAGPAVGLIFDGTGYGPDGTVWGGEVLVGDLGGFERAGHLHPVRLPGGEAAIREPWRMACAWLVAAGDAAARPGAPPIPETLRDRVEAERWSLVADLARRGVSAPVTTSVGRLFDAVSALCGLRAEVTYEGQAAVELEMAAARSPADGSGGGYGFELRQEVGSLVLDPRPVIRALLDDLAGGVPVSVVAARFHEGLARGAVRAAEAAGEAAGTDLVVLSGGVFQNVRLLERTAGLLAEAGLRPLVPELLPPNDGGISYGQAAAAAGRGARP